MSVFWWGFLCGIDTWILGGFLFWLAFLFTAGFPLQ